MRGTDAGMWTREAPSQPAKVAVVIPCYRVEREIRAVIAGLPSFVSLIVCVNDASPDGTAAAVRAANDPRVVLVEHARNQGVGGAMVTGYRECLRRGADVVVKVDGDGQMDPAHLPALLRPLLDATADFTKGNRWHDAARLTAMPRLRRLGNLGLSFLTKLASGYWKIFDPCNGYTAVRAEVLEQVPLDHLARDYFFESSLLVELYVLRAVVRDVPMPARYGDERSSLRISRVLWSFPPRLLRGLVYRVWARHFVRDFSAVALFLSTGLALTLFGGLFGSWAWLQSYWEHQPATAGTVMLSALPFMVGFQLLLQAAVADMADQPDAPRTAEAPLRLAAAAGASYRRAA